jgi:hypothetical protein
MNDSECYNYVQDGIGYKDRGGRIYAKMALDKAEWWF